MSGTRKSWLMDLGNSRLKLGLLDESGTLGETTAIDISEPGFAATVRSIAGSAPGAPAWLASVGPASAVAQIEQVLAGNGHALHRVFSQARLGRLRNRYADPASLGVDRFLGMLAALQRNDGPWLIVSAGSALTVDLLAVDGDHGGGMIAPMPRELRSALASRFKALDLPAGTPGSFADNTADAIASGIRNALLGLVERCLRDAEVQLGQSPTLLLTGGAASLLAPLTHARTVIVTDLVLLGLAVVARGDCQ